MEKEILYLENLLAIRESEIKKLKAAIAVLNGTEPNKAVTSSPIIPEKKTVKRKKYKKRKKKTIKDLVLMSFRDNKPKTKLEILEYVQRTKGESYQVSSLSPQISSLMKTNLNKCTISGDQTSNKYYYGLNDWFEEDKIMTKYVDNLSVKA